MGRLLFSGMAACLVCLLAACGDNAASPPDEANPGVGGTNPVSGAGGSQAGSGGQGGGAQQGGGGGSGAPDAAGDGASSPPSDAPHATHPSDAGGVILPSPLLLYSPPHSP